MPPFVWSTESNYVLCWSTESKYVLCWSTESKYFRFQVHRVQSLFRLTKTETEKVDLFRHGLASFVGYKKGSRIEMPMRAFPSTVRTNQNENPFSVSVSVRGAPHRKGQPEFLS